MKMKTVDQTKIKGSKTKHFIVLTAVLFGFWLLLSGKMEAKYLTIGFVTSVISAWLTFPLLLIPSADGKHYIWAFDFPYGKYFIYWFWLLWEIVKANIDIAMVVLNPKLPINPQMVTFKKPMFNSLAHVTLANSITLTPGTVTIDVEDGVYAVHALTDGAAEGLLSGEMQKKVAQVFNEQVSREKGEQ